MQSRMITLIWREAEDGADVTLLAGDGSGLAPLVWAGPHRFDRRQADVEASTLARAVRRAVVRGKDTAALVASGRLLFDLLLPGPVKAVLRGSAGILTVVGGGWPWPLLHDGSGHLGLRWALGEVGVGVAPEPAARASGDEERLLIVADPAADLPAARYEGEALMREMSAGAGCDLRLGRLRRQDFLRIFRSYRLVHFAGHADPADDSGPAGWRLGDGRVDARALSTLAGGAAPALVFANACRSAQAAEVGDALLAAGVRHFVGTTDDLPDLPGADFATAFYRGLRDGAPVGEALRRARVAAAESGQAVWAAYRLRGDPRTVYFRTRRVERWAPGVRQAVLLAIRRPHEAGGADGLAEAHQRWREALRVAVGRHGGRLLAGRAAVDRAVFGVPVTFENDVHRAARAAQAVAEAHPEAVVVLDAGPVVATGADVVGQAALAAEAATWRLKPGVYGLGGVVQRLASAATWGPEVDSARPLIGLGETRPVDELPLVGRAAEIGRLMDLADEVERAGRAAAVTVVGPAGIGKSRLLDGVARRLAGRFRVVRGAGIPYDEGTPFAVATGVIRGLCGLGEGADESPDELRAALHALVERLDGQGAALDLDVMPIDALLSGDVGGPGLSEQIDALAALCGLDPPPGAQPPDPQSLPAAFRLLIEAAAAEAALAVFVEDVHWLPDVGRAVVDPLIGALDGPVLVVASGRPALADKVAHWFERPRHTRLDLGPLSEREAEAVLRQTFAGASKADAEALLARAEGNPLFLRELALSRASGASGAPPPTVEGVMQARLDRLAPLEREVARAAAVLGRTFWQAGVERLLGRDEGVSVALAALERRRFVQAQPGSELPGQSQWRFNHGLMFEVVYHGIAGRARAAWHGRAALWLADEAQAGPDRWARIAVHRAAAGDHARAAEAWLEAAERAHQTSAAGEALRAWRAALAEDVAASGSLAAEVRGEAQVRLADLERGAGDLASAAALLDAAVAGSSGVVRAERLHRRARIDEAQGDLAGARARLEAARAELRDVSQAVGRPVQLNIRRYEGWLAYRDGDADRAVALLAALLDEVPDADAELKGLVLNTLGIAAYGQGDFDAAGRALRQALALFEQRGSAVRMATCFTNLGLVAARQGDVAGAVGWYERAVRLHVKRGDRTALAQAYNNLGTIYGDVGDYGRAARYLREVIRIRESTGHAGLALGYANLGEVFLKQGRSDDAADHLDRAFKLCAAGKGPGYLLPDIWRMRAELNLAIGEPAAAVDAAREALTRAEERSDRPRIGAALRVLGEALAASGDDTGAEAQLLHAVEVLEAVEYPAELARAYAARARHLARLGDPEADALQARADALLATIRR